MAIVEAHRGQVEGHPDPLIERARQAGFELATRRTDTGQAVWEWRRGNEPRPQFVAERVARHWMFRWLDQFENRGR